VTVVTIGISGYGAYVPRLRIKKEDYAKAWGSFSAAGVSEKSVMGFDEDVLTMAVKTAIRALDSVPLTPDKITRFSLASTSPPYLEKVLSSTVITGTGMLNGVFASDHTTSTRAGTESLLACLEHVQANPANRALAVASDSPRASMWDPIEHGLGAGAAGFVLSSENLIAELEGHASYASEHFGERFRTADDDRIRDLNVKRFSAASFVGNITKAGGALMKRLGTKAEDYSHVVLQQPDARTPGSAAAKMSFTDEQQAVGLVAKYLGDLGAASVSVGLAAVLDSAKVGDRILVISYGSGAGSDALSLKVVADRKSSPSVGAEAERKEYIDYIQYLKIKGAIV
jgi:hydroxymethylglutaryl-CoA synthase